MDVDKIEYFFNALNKENLAVVDQFYDEQAVLQDPIGKQVGVAQIKDYYRRMYQNVEQIKFDFHDSVQQDQKFVVMWTMTLKASSLNSGNPVKVEGNSHIVINPKNDKAIYHRDYFDMGEFIYEHIPVLGRLVNFVKGKLK